MNETETTTEAPPIDLPLIIPPVEAPSVPAPRRSRSKASAPPTADPAGTDAASAAAKTPKAAATPEPEPILKVARSLSWMRFIYPFSFDATNFDNHVKAISDGMVDDEGSLPHHAHDSGPVWNLISWKQTGDNGRSEEGGGDLLPHVARFLGEPQEYSRGPLPPRTAYMWALDKDYLSRLLNPEPDITWNLRLWRENIPFEVDDVQLAMFRHGVGFLTITARPTETTREGSLETWLNFMYGLRFLRGKPYARVRALPPYVEPAPEEATESSDTETEAQVTPPAPEAPPEPRPRLLPPEFPDSWEEGGDLLRKLIVPALLTASIKEPLWWEEVFVPGQLIPYVALYVDRKPKAGPVPEAELYDLLYRLRNVVADRQHISMSNTDKTFDHPDLLQYADFMWFYFSLSAGGFLAYNAPSTGPYRTSMPKKHLKEEYFLAFLLSLQQRFVLGVLTNKIAEHWLPSGGARPNENWNIKKLLNSSNSEDARSIQFDDLLENFLMFSARGNFVQLMQGEHHQLYYQKWQSKFQIKELFEEVQSELDAMHSYLEMTVQQNVNHILHVLTVLSIVLGIVGTFTGWWALNLDNISTSLDKWHWPDWLVWFSFLLIIPILGIGLVIFRSIGWLPRRPSKH